MRHKFTFHHYDNFVLLDFVLGENTFIEKKALQLNLLTRLIFFGQFIQQTMAFGCRSNMWCNWFLSVGITSIFFIKCNYIQEN